jgi:hypothetical protein
MFVLFDILRRLARTNGTWQQLASIGGKLRLDLTTKISVGSEPTANHPYHEKVASKFKSSVENEALDTSSHQHIATPFL